MSSSGSMNKSKSEGSSQYNESVWAPQGSALSQMYGQAANTFGNNAQYSDQFNNMAQQLEPYMQNVLGQAQSGYEGQMGGGAIGNTDDIRSQLMQSMQSTAGGSQMGNMYNSIVGGQGNSYIDPMVDQMNQSYDQRIAQGQSGTAMDAAAMGQGGSSRHAMQNAMQGAQMEQDRSLQEANMRGNAYDTDLNMKLDIARQADQGIQNTQDRLQGMLGSADANQQAAMNYGSQMQNLGMGSMAPWQQASQQPWDAMNQYAGVLGGPTVLGSGTSNQKGSSKGSSKSSSLKG